MEFDIHCNKFLFDNENGSFDWSFATDTLSDITGIVSAESMLVPVPDSIGQVDFEVPDLCPFATHHADHFFVPNYPVPWYHGKNETSQSYVPFSSNVYSIHDPNIPILEALPLNPVPITLEAMDTDNSALLSSDFYSVHDPNNEIFYALPLNPVLITPESMDTPKSAKNEEVLSHVISADTYSASIPLHSNVYLVHDHIQILEALPPNPVPIAPEAVDTGNSAKKEAVFTRGLFFDEKVVNLVEERVPVERKDTGRARLAHIGYNEMKQYFYMPITQAAKEMKVGLTILKKRCRELGIPRWPHRKMKSLRSLINNVQELGKSNTIRNMKNELEALGRLMEENPDMQLTEKTKKWRQACFKASYKKRRGQLTYYQPRF